MASAHPKRKHGRPQTARSSSCVSQRYDDAIKDASEATRIEPSNITNHLRKLQPTLEKIKEADTAGETSDAYKLTSQAKDVCNAALMHMSTLPLESDVQGRASQALWRADKAYTKLSMALTSYPMRSCACRSIRHFNSATVHVGANASDSSI